MVSIVDQSYRLESHDDHSDRSYNSMDQSKHVRQGDDLGSGATKHTQHGDTVSAGSTQVKNGGLSIGGSAEQVHVGTKSGYVVALAVEDKPVNLSWNAPQDSFVATASYIQSAGNSEMHVIEMDHR